MVVGLDFGTTFGGYAYYHKDIDADKIFMFYEWSEQASGGGQPYCKTQTSLFYAPDSEGKLHYKSYGWPTSVEYNMAVLSATAKSPQNFNPHRVGHLLKKFKLNWAPDRDNHDCDYGLPSGLTTEIVITDYLREISKSIM